MNQPENSVTDPQESAQPTSNVSLGKILTDYYLHGATKPIPLTIPARMPANLPDSQQRLLNSLAATLDQASQPQLDPRQTTASLRRAEIILRNMKEPLPRGQTIQEIWAAMAQVPAAIPTIKALQGVLPTIQYEPGLNIVAAPTSAGKTSLIIQQVLEWLRDPQSTGTILFWSAETSRSKVWAKLWASLASTLQTTGRAPISMHTVLDAARGKWQGTVPFEILQAQKMMDPVSKRLIVLDETVTAWELIEMARRFADESPDGLYALVIDYIQELPAVPDDHPWAARLLHSRELEVGTGVRMLREFGHEYGVPVVAAAQFNRTVGKNSDYIPDLQQLRESGRIEQNAAMVIGMRNEIMSGADGANAQHNGSVAPTKTYSMWDTDELREARAGSMATVRTELGQDWILLEAFVLKNREWGGVGTVIPMGFQPASGRIEPLPFRLLSGGGKGGNKNKGSNNGPTAKTQPQEDHDDDDYFGRA